MQTQQLEPDTFKRAARDMWDRTAMGWNDSTSLIRPWLREATDAMLHMAAIKTGSRVLDVAAGAGDQTLDIAARVGPTGHVLATDLSARILDFARENIARAGYTDVDFRTVDGERLGVPAESFDAAVSRLGLMLFPDPLQGLRNMRNALKPSGMVCTTVFSTPASNPCVAICMTTALQYAGLPSPDPYQPGGLMSLGKPGRIDELFTQAGLRSVATTRLAAPFRLGSARAYLDFIRTSGAPIVQILGRVDEDTRRRAWGEMEQKLRQFDTAGGWEGPNELLLTVGGR